MASGTYPKGNLQQLYHAIHSKKHTNGCKEALRTGSSPVWGIREQRWFMLKLDSCVRPGWAGWWAWPRTQLHRELGSFMCLSSAALAAAADPQVYLDCLCAIRERRKRSDETDSNWFWPTQATEHIPAVCSLPLTCKNMLLLPCHYINWQVLCICLAECEIYTILVIKFFLKGKSHKCTLSFRIAG